MMASIWERAPMDSCTAVVAGNPKKVEEIFSLQSATYDPTHEYEFTELPLEYMHYRRWQAWSATGAVKSRR